ncbi:TRAP transporter large permease subunit [Clostridium sp. C1]|uniref:TRAP transporter large permease subunit n=1 Tax=Clostridium sp. C1 TaxID=1155388 RepID=UPI001BAC5BE3|nr:TRAP transporter large permease subunit [Clostridium sp. C1]QUN12895.1 TRAP transporter large permease subunit [Clostridium sp. C1]
MPVELLYILLLLIVICIVFVLFKRPIYEAMFFGYISMLLVTGQLSNIFTYIIQSSKDSLLYSIIAFLVLAKILDKTEVVDRIVEIIIAIVGRFRGGAGYAAVISSTFMGALSGSGAGNVAATGVFTIPSMKKSGFPAHLAANIEAASSTMGNMIPPSGVILASLACYNEFTNSNMEQSVFWIAMWGVAIWFIIQRMLTVFVFCRIYDVEPMKKEEIPHLKTALKNGWKELLLPVIILLPFVLDYLFKNTLFTVFLGEGASNLSSSLLIFTPGIAAIYALLISKKKYSFKNLVNEIGDSVQSIVPVSATIFFSYCISNLFTATNVGNAIGDYIASFNLPLVALAILLPLFTAILGMVLPGTAQTKIFGTTIISIFTAAGGNPLLAAIMLPVITGAMEGITPPLAVCVYTAMGIADADFIETLKNCIVWVSLHYILSVLCFLGILPVIGL